MKYIPDMMPEGVPLENLADMNMSLMNTTIFMDLVMDPMWVESNRMHTINGFCFANVPHIQMKVNETVRWYVIGLGNQKDLHTPHWHGQTLNIHGHNTDVVEILPASMITIDMVPDNPGLWLYHCHVNHHLHGGMSALYEVQPCKISCPRATPIIPVESPGASPKEETTIKTVTTPDNFVVISFVFIASLVPLLCFVGIAFRCAKRRDLNQYHDISLKS